MEIIQEEVAPKGVKKRRFTLFRASLVCFVVFTLLCGLAYPLSVTLAAQTAFPYEANGSQIIVTMPDARFSARSSSTPSKSRPLSSISARKISFPSKDMFSLPLV